MLDEVVVTPSSLAACARRSTTSRRSPIDIFGEDRVHVASRLDDALDEAIGLVEAGGAIGGGVLATGSITVAADVRVLFSVR